MNDKAATSLDRKTLLALVEASRAIISELELRDVFARIAEQAAEEGCARSGLALTIVRPDGPPGNSPLPSQRLCPKPAPPFPGPLLPIPASDCT